VAIASMHAMAHGTFAELNRLTHPEAVNREAVDEPPAASEPGAAGFWATALWLREAFSDLAFEIHEVVEVGDLVVVHNTMSGRHTGNFVGWDQGEIEVVMPPTGLEFASTQTHWMRFRDGLVFEHWANRDDFGTAQQLGWAPPSPAFLFRQVRATRRARRLLARERASQLLHEGQNHWE
jgi:predicted ester cyclase